MNDDDDDKYSLNLPEGTDIKIREESNVAHFPPGPTREMAIYVFAEDPDGNQIQIGAPTQLHVPKGFEIKIRCRAANQKDGVFMLPYEWGSETDWRRDMLMDPGFNGIGLWGDDDDES